MKIKLTALTAILLLTGGAAFQDDKDIQQAREKWEREKLAQLNLPVPDGGITIKPNKEMTSYPYFKAEREKRDADIKKYGYVHQYSEDATQLMAKHIKPAADVKPLDQVPFAFSFPAIVATDALDVEGFAPMGAHTDQGWSGGVELFTSPVGKCRLEVNAVNASHGSIIIAQEQVTYNVNGKPTLTTITGMENPVNKAKSAFLYTVDWYDTAFFRHIECAATSYSPSIMAKIVDFARHSD